MAKSRKTTPTKEVIGVTNGNGKIEKITNASRIIGNKVNLKCKNIKQKEFANLIKEKEIVICSGPAGTGKSYVSIAIAIGLLQDADNSYNKLLIIRPAVEADENLGFLPGDLKEKLAPFLAPSIDIVDKIIGESSRIRLEESGDLKGEPLGFIRGKSIDNSIVIVEECQNMTPTQVKTLLTRIGYGSKFVISGDMDQSDRYKRIEDTGLYDAIKKHGHIPEIGVFEFDENDIVRNPLITKILKNYKDNTKEDNYNPKRIEE
jgi:phosphate starvation-inducible PhoH-like protein